MLFRSRQQLMTEHAQCQAHRPGPLLHTVSMQTVEALTVSDGSDQSSQTLLPMPVTDNSTQTTSHHPFQPLADCDCSLSPVVGQSADSVTLQEDEQCVSSVSSSSLLPTMGDELYHSAQSHLSGNVEMVDQATETCERDVAEKAIGASECWAEQVEKHKLLENLLRRMEAAKKSDDRSLQRWRKEAEQVPRLKEELKKLTTLQERAERLNHSHVEVEGQMRNWEKKWHQSQKEVRELKEAMEAQKLREEKQEKAMKEVEARKRAAEHERAVAKRELQRSEKCREEVERMYQETAELVPPVKALSHALVQTDFSPLPPKKHSSSQEVVGKKMNGSKSHAWGYAKRHGKMDS